MGSKGRSTLVLGASRMSHHQAAVDILILQRSCGSPLSWRGDECSQSLDILWHSLGFELTVGMGLENSGHFAGFIPKEPFHPTVFPAEERVVLAGEKFDGFLAPGLGELGESIALAHDGNFAFVAAVDQSVVADVIVQVVVWGRLPILVRYVGFL